MTITRQQFLREVLQLTKQRMMLRVANTTASRVTSNSSSMSLSTELTTNANFAEIVLCVGYIFIIIAFVVKILLRIIRNFDDCASPQTYNPFGFMMNEESDFESEFVSDVESSPSSPVSSRPTLSGKYLHFKTPVQMNDAVTPKTPLPPPIRRSLRLKIKSENNLYAMQNNTIITRSQSRQIQNIVISSDPCPAYIRNHDRGSMITPSPHPEHDEERAYYIQYCNEKKLRKQRREFNSPLFVRRLVL